jgi:hypothetical protein
MTEAHPAALDRWGEGIGTPDFSMHRARVRERAAG